MSTILDTIADATRKRVEEDKLIEPLESMAEKARAVDCESGRFRKALQQPELRFICEVKKASPSKGIIDPEFPYLAIASEYERAGADCISCLTEPQWFLGSDGIFAEIRNTVSTPMIRKDFTVDEYQIYQAKCMGADAVLLICSLLDAKTLNSYLSITQELGMDAIVETHNAEEIEMAVSAEARIIGVNNRNLKDFSVNFDNARKLRELVPPGCVYVAESGVKTADDVAAIAAMGADAALIGEAFMRSDDKVGMLASFREAARKAGE